MGTGISLLESVAVSLALGIRARIQGEPIPSSCLLDLPERRLGLYIECNGIAGPGYFVSLKFLPVQNDLRFVVSCLVPEEPPVLSVYSFPDSKRVFVSDVDFVVPSGRMVSLYGLPLKMCSLSRVIPIVFPAGLL